MIYMNSLVDGFPVILGSLPVQFAMFVAMCISIRIPKDADDERDGKATEIYYLTFFAHVANIICQLLKHYLSPWWHLEKKILTIVVLMY